MREYIERAKDFIHQIFPYIEECIQPWAVHQKVVKFNNDYDRHVKVCNGLSRIALITSDYVVKFDYDPDEVDSIGGCGNEFELYYEAKVEGFDYLFAEITPYQYKDHQFYIMPRINGVGSGHHYAEHYMNEEEKGFCRKHRITDLHSNNYGFRNGKVCLIDYACHLSYDSDYECYLDDQSYYC